MTWTKIDENAPHNPKLMAAGLDAFGFDVAAMCYANRYGTDGFIADSALSAVFPPAKSPKRLAMKLVEVGRWKRDDGRGGYEIHDFLEFNFSAQELEERRRLRAEAGRKGGIRSGMTRRGELEADASANASSNGEANALAPASHLHEPKPNPDPDPGLEVPLKRSSGEPTRDELVNRLVAATKKRGTRTQKAAEQIIDRGLVVMVPTEVERLVGWAEQKRPDTPSVIWEPMRKRAAEIGTSLPESWAS